jgi:hypothetical protein
MHPQHHHLVVYLMTAARIFTTKTFSKWQRKTGMGDQSLIKAIQEIQSGLVDAQLAKGLVKKRVAQSGRGKQSSARTLVATYFEDRWFFIFGFLKNEKSNITAKELQWLMIFAQQLLGLNEHELSIAIEVGELYEIKPESA